MSSKGKIRFEQIDLGNYQSGVEVQIGSGENFIAFLLHQSDVKGVIKALNFFDKESPPEEFAMDLPISSLDDCKWNIGSEDE